MLAQIRNYSIFSETVPDEYQYFYEPSLYHSEKYLLAQPVQPEYRFWLTEPEKSRIIGTMNFYRDENKAESQRFAPFGSYDGLPLPVDIATELLKAVLTSLGQSGIEDVLVTASAGCYSDQEVWAKAYNAVGFSFTEAINYHLPIDHLPFSEKIHKMERRKLQRGQQFYFQTNPIQELSEIYLFIEKCRQERGQSLSMSLQRLLQVAKEIPEHLVVTSLKYQQQLVAASIIIKVNSTCWYQFYPAHSLKYNRESPMVFLLSKVYTYAREQGVKILDLGTSELKGKSLDGLLKFKSRVGGIVTSRRVYTKCLKQNDIQAG